MISKQSDAGTIDDKLPSVKLNCNRLTIESVRHVGSRRCTGMKKVRMSTARDWVVRDAVYLSGREPAMRMSYQSPGALRPISSGAHMRDADQCSKQVGCIQISAQIATPLSALDEPIDRALDHGA